MTTQKLQLTELGNGQANYLNANESLARIDQLLQAGVVDKDLNAPPGSPANAALYIVGGSPTGAWAGQALNLAYWLTAVGQWTFVTRREGMLVHVNDEDTYYTYNGSAWVALQDRRKTVTSVSSSSGVVTLNYALGDYFTLTLTENVTSWVISNPPGSGLGFSLMIQITQDSTPRTVAKPGTTPGGELLDVSTGSGAVDLLAITSFNNGTTLRSNIARDYL